MVFIPTWITNILFLITVYLSGFQHLQLRRPNPVTNIQFFIMAFSVAMIVIVAVYNRVNPWLSLAFLITSVANLGVVIRQHRMLPPTKMFE
jgi:hypothetical protein